jgi:hypothetical protein
MPHCNPAPPHPEPGQVYNAICIEPWMPLALTLMLLGLLLYAGILRGYFPGAAT